MKITCQAARAVLCCWSSGAVCPTAGSPLFPPYLLPFLSKLRTIHQRGGYCQVREQFPITLSFLSFQGKLWREAVCLMSRCTMWILNKRGENSNSIHIGRHYSCYAVPSLLSQRIQAVSSFRRAQVENKGY